MRHSISIILRTVTAIILTVSTVLAFASCTAEKKSILWYQDTYKAVRCTVDTGSTEYNSFTLQLSYGDAVRVEIESPAELAGAVFKIDGEHTTLSVGGRVVDMSTSGIGDVERIMRAFSLKEEEISSVAKNESGDTVFGALVTGGVYTVTLDGDGIPKNIRFDGVSTIDITDIAVYEYSSDLPKIRSFEELYGSDSGDFESTENADSAESGSAESESTEG